MPLWIEWFRCVRMLRVACTRTRSFLWMALALLGLGARPDLAGVTSFVRAGYLGGFAYRRLLHFFHSEAVCLDMLVRAWVGLVLCLFQPLHVRGYLVAVADGLKVGKEGRKMPAVKSLHQESTDNSKPAYIMGHSFQALGLLVRGPLSALFAVPLASRIHEGLVWSNRTTKTLLDKLVALFLPIAEILGGKVILLVDAFYASRKVILPLFQKGHEIVTRVRSNTVAYEPAQKPKEPKRGRPKLYDRKIRLRKIWKQIERFLAAPSPVYGEKDVEIRYLSMDLLWRPVGKLVRFVFVDHPARGRMILMTTLLALDPIEVIRLYGYRFKIEVSFKQALHTVGSYAYHFWMKAMTPIRRGSGNQHLHMKTEEYRRQVRRKMRAYHLHVQLGCIAQGLLQHLAANRKDSVWANFRSWMRTMRPGAAPSEAVVAQAMRSSLPEFLFVCRKTDNIEKFLAEHADMDRIPGAKLAG